MKFLEVSEGHCTRLPDFAGLREQAHVFDKRSILAVNAAIAARRPLLVRGEPGTGKSQLAQAVAREFSSPLLSQVVDARTEAQDLLWQFDSVRRLAAAQLASALTQQPEAIEKKLAVNNFLAPGPLWWAFDWGGADKQALDASAPVQEAPKGWNREQGGCVVLIDEIDKAESDVPNGLLEALGALRFTPFGRTRPVVAKGEPPLVIITTNEERALPDAFLRRCIVLKLELPATGEGLIAFLIQRGQAHFANAHADVLAEAAQLLNRDREEAIAQHRRPRPGQAEYLDLVRAVLELKDTAGEQKQHLQAIAEFSLKKNA